MSSLLQLLQLVAKYGPMLQELAKNLPALLEILKQFSDSFSKVPSVQNMYEGDLDAAIQSKMDELAHLVSHKIK